jgi:hypothetical protein
MTKECCVSPCEMNTVPQLRPHDEKVLPAKLAVERSIVLPPMVSVPRPENDPWENMMRAFGEAETPGG